MLAVVVVEGVAVALLGLLVAGLLRSHAEILRSLHRLGAGLLDDGPPTSRPVTVALTGRAAPDLVGMTSQDEAVAIGVGGAVDTVLAFLSTRCATCAGFWAAVAAQPPPAPHGARVVVVTRDATEESPHRLRELAPAAVPVVLSSAAWVDYQVPGSPYFVYVQGVTGRVVGEGTAGSWPQVVDLLGQAVRDAQAASRSGDRPDRVAGELAAAGVRPGDPSLYGPPEEGPSERAPSGDGPSEDGRARARAAR